ncbi:hypothetical protein GCM10011492_20660 [Flexivirga endophytica]|uniref:Uncharacterized protein n=1 Tax=Flexivirga endophytica TaxID=1849103 RepID=A0A916T374_9MICO|nr:hypothetical protein GCM10011492_20660 [Flexivirga endophytica]GHB51028.1 hypothetical protein GCM10008112_19930 [Flexivirga endophytica]
MNGHVRCLPSSLAVAGEEDGERATCAGLRAMPPLVRQPFPRGLRSDPSTGAWTRQWQVFGLVTPCAGAHTYWSSLPGLAPSAVDDVRPHSPLRGQCRISTGFPLSSGASVVAKRRLKHPNQLRCTHYLVVFCLPSPNML